MSIQSRIKRLKQLQTEVFDSTRVTQILKDLQRIKNVQLNANRSQIQQGLKQSIPALAKVINDNAKQLQQGQHQILSRQIRSFMGWNPVSALSSQLSSVIQQISKSKKQRQQIKQQNKNQTKAIEKAINVAADQSLKLKIDLKNVNPNVQFKRSFSGIQQQIQPIKQLLDSQLSNSISSIQNIPPSVGLLDKYARLSGFQQIGPITDKYGKSYIGRRTIKQGNQTFILPFPKNQIVNGQTPNITQNFKFHANKAINQWNGFVQAQNNLIQFMKKVSTPQKRTEYVQQKLKGLTKATFAAMALSTLTYYYVQIPIQNFAKFNLNQYDGSRLSFEVSYKVGGTISKNPFLLTNQQGLKIFQQLMIKDFPVNILNNIGKLISQFQSPLNSSKINKFGRFVADKGYQAINFFNSAGIPEQRYKNTLQSGIIDSNLKKKKFILPSPFQNTQILELLAKVDKQTQKQQNKKWQIQWGGQSLPCHDYIWNYEI